MSASQANKSMPGRNTGGRTLLILALLLSILLNVLLCAGLVWPGTSEAAARLSERTLAGNEYAADKIAVVRIEGLIVDGLLQFVHRQIDEAARDPAVKAVVIRVDSPGGTITASDDLLTRLERLRDGKPRKQNDRVSAKPLVVSMGSVAASGGYYISMAAAQPTDSEPLKKIFAERTTITGSIGVYASLPNAKGLSDKIGFRMELIHAGDIKGSGSPFHDMTPQERQPWQDMVDNGYQRFLEVVGIGRPVLKGKMTEALFPVKKIPRYDDKGNAIEGKSADYTRRRADGGIFTAQQALDFGLIDALGTLDDAVAEAGRQAGVTNWRAIVYDKPQSLLASLTGLEIQANSMVGDSPLPLDLMPKFWYLMPHSEVAARHPKP